MAAENKDNWSSEAYQHSASFVPKLAITVMRWLDPQKDDVILDIGCGDGVLDLDIAKILRRGNGRLHGIDSSPSMIDAAGQKVAGEELENCKLEVLDATELVNRPDLQQQQFTKVFSNAAMHWILRPESKREAFFRGVTAALAPGGRFVVEMGGLGNVGEIRAAVLMAVARRVGLERALEVDPWFFPDEAWVRDMLESIGGWEVERTEREWRPTPADAGGVEGWVRLMAKQLTDAVPEDQREACIREIVDVLEVICAKPDGGYNFNYVRLRISARKVEA